MEPFILEFEYFYVPSLTFHIIFSLFSWPLNNHKPSEEKTRQFINYEHFILNKSFESRFHIVIFLSSAAVAKIPSFLEQQTAKT